MSADGPSNPLLFSSLASTISLLRIKITALPAGIFYASRFLSVVAVSQCTHLVLLTLGYCEVFCLCVALFHMTGRISKGGWAHWKVGGLRCLPVCPAVLGGATSGCNHGCNQNMQPSIQFSEIC